MAEKIKGQNPVEIMIVEDNPHDAELIIRTLIKKNLVKNYFHAEDGEEALDFVLRRGKFSARNNSSSLKVIFLDLKLPKVDGLEVLKELKTNPLTRHVPIVVITSSKEEGDIKSAFELGANSYVVKPVDFDSFYQTMTNTGNYWLIVNEAFK